MGLLTTYTVQMERGPELIREIRSFKLADQIAQALARAKPYTCFLIVDSEGWVRGRAFSRKGLPEPKF